VGFVAFNLDFSGGGAVGDAADHPAAVVLFSKNSRFYME
jgi:hypothetical protein